MTEEERLMMADMLRRENNLLQYHQNSINNNMIFDEKGRPTTAYITGLVDPEKPERLYAIPAYDNILGKIINNEDELTDTDKKYLTDITEKFVEDNISADDAKKKNALEFIQQLLIKME